jgi:F-type H+-transporting ATPase subunit b
MVTIDITMFIQLVNILVLIVIMNAILYRPIRRILEQRQKKVADLEKEIENYNRNAALRLEEFDRKIQEARQNAKAEVDGQRGEAQSAAALKVTEVRGEFDQKKNEQFSQIEAQLTSVRQEMQGQIEGFARDMAGKVMGRAL